VSPAVQIRLLGEFSVAVDGAVVGGLHSARLQSLLAYLLLNRTTPQSRQQLAFLFWPETSDSQAQTNLRQLLHTLRRRLPAVADALLVDERTIRWRADVSLQLDVAEFEAALARARQTTGSERLKAFEEAAAVYRGPLAPDCYDDWIQADRERLAQQRLGALEQCVLLHEERRAYAQAIDWARQLLAADPLHEATYRRLMRLHALNHDRIAAMRIYHTCVAVLEQELAVEPSAATRELYERLVNTAGNALEPLARTSGRQRDTSVALVGRQREWQALQAAWRTANRGAVHCVVLSGEAGLGKTRLAEEMIHWASQQGIPTAVARGFAAGRDLAYATLVECLRSEPVAPLRRRLDPAWRSELARLLPELLAEDPRLPRPEPLNERWQRQRLFEALAHVFVARNRPFVLALDDMQWYANETLEWISFLVRFEPRARLLVIGCLRSDEIDAGHPVTQLLLDLRGAGLLTELALAPLSAEETHALADQLADRALDAAAVQALYRFTEGNPLFVVETVRADLDAARLAQPVESPAPGAPSPALPPRVQSVIQSRLAQLSAAAHELAALAATIGRSFTFDVLARACAQGEDVVVRSLDELWQRRLVREQGANAYDFSHDRIRDVAYAEISPARRRSLHRRVAQALEHVYGVDSDATSAQIAGHFEQAGDIQQAVVYYQRATEVALGFFAYPDAIAMLNHAVSLARMLPAGPAATELELELQMRLCTAWSASTSFLGSEADAAYTRALDLCRQAEHKPHLFTTLWGLHEVALYRAEYEQSLALAHQCLEIAAELGDPGLLLEAHHAAWGPCCFLGDYAKAFEHMQAGLAVYDRALHEPLSVHYGVHDAGTCALYESALVLWNMGYLDQARDQQARAVALARELTLPANIADAYSYAGFFCHLLHDPASTGLFAGPALQISTDKGYPYTRMLSAVLLGWSLAMQGQVAEGLALARQGMDAAKDIGLRLHYSQLAVMFAEILMAAGRHEEAIEVLDEGIRRFETYHDLLCAPDLWTLKGDALLALNAPCDEIMDCYRAALALARRLRAQVSALRAATRLAHFQHGHGQWGEGRRELQEIYDWFDEGHDTPDLQVAAAML
jgi:DNA-binding SARP family transcriptional activator